MTADIFAWGVASGDPAPDGVTLWTRVCPTAALHEGGTCPTAALHEGGIPSSPTAPGVVDWRVATDPAMRDVVAAGNATAGAATDWTVKVRVRDPALAPATTYWYRFAALGVTSGIGRCRTLPDPGAPLPRLRLGYVSCQDFTSGRFHALAALADADVDYVIHLGDYIYETVSDPQFQRRGPSDRQLRLPGGGLRAETLEDYRWLYRRYRRDPDLQRLHARHTVIAIWDDHEFANDGYGVHDIDTLDEQANADPQRRSAASQAWTEYLPADVPFDPALPPLEQIRIHRRFVFGNLAELVLTDERLYRDGPPCGLERAQRYATRGCAAQADRDRTMLGVPQRQWLVDRLTTSSRRWKLWGNETMVMPLRLPGWLAKRLHPHAGDVPMLSDVWVSLDQWDGFQAERAMLTDALVDVDGLVVLTGDLHSFIAGTLRTDDGHAVATCLMTGSVTSANLVEMIAGRTLPSLPLPLTRLVASANPQLDFVNSSAHGFTLLDIDHDRLRCEMIAVSGVRAPFHFRWRLHTIELPAPAV
ncbi:MAG: alkaline phosphatase D family protein [Actinobacteria bacterium]|nr:alkaline phosphatase D family protein [Actinomycetota bacterium]